MTRKPSPASELKALRTRGAIFDMSPLAKYLISGSDAEKMLNRLIPRDIAKLRVGQIYYSPWCTEEGKIIGDEIGPERRAQARISRADTCGSFIHFIFHLIQKKRPKYETENW